MEAFPTIFCFNLSLILSLKAVKLWCYFARTEKREIQNIRDRQIQSKKTTISRPYHFAAGKSVFEKKPGSEHGRKWRELPHHHLMSISHFVSLRVVELTQALKGMTAKSNYVLIHPGVFLRCEFGLWGKGIPKSFSKQVLVQGYYIDFHLEILPAWSMESIPS